MNREYSDERRGGSRARGASRGRNARKKASERGGYSQETRKTTGSSGSRNSYSGNYGRNSRNRRGNGGSGKAGLAIGGVVAAAALVIGAAALFKSGLLGHATIAESEVTETTALVLDQNVINTDLYLDYSALAPNAELLNLKGMTEDEVLAKLQESYSWSLTVKNPNPNLDSFTMVDLEEESQKQESSGGGADDEGTEERVEVSSPYASVTIRPTKSEFVVPDLIQDTLKSYVDQIFTDYDSKRDGIASSMAAENEAKASAEQEKDKDKDKESTEDSSAESSSAAPQADYALVLPDFTDTVKDEMTQLALVWKMSATNGGLTGYDSEKGEFVFGGSKDGYEIDAEATAEKVLASLSAGTYTGEITAVGNAVSPSGSVKSKYTTIGSYTTKTTSNSVRNKNIQLAAKALNGTVLKPGQEFSFNETVGQRTEAKGYGGAPAYNNGEVVQEVGGGVCQVSTTLYNAVFRAGLTSTYRRSHTFAPTYVTPGMDATVSWPGPDYQFVNNSDYPIGIRASYSDQSLTVSIYGVRILPEGVTWELTSEKVKDLPVPAAQIITPAEGSESNGSAGSEWQAYKIITTNGKTEKVKDHYTTYKGHTPKKYADGTTTAAESSSAAESGATESSSGSASAAESSKAAESTSAAETTAASTTAAVQTQSPAPETTGSDTVISQGPVVSDGGPSGGDDVISGGPGES